MRVVPLATLAVLVALLGSVCATVERREKVARDNKARIRLDSPYSWTWKSALKIPAADNVTLRADAFVPDPKTTGETFPVVIFPNSWGCPQIEYIVRALNLADNGYIGFEYETRGWYTSGGVIDVAGPMDRLDGSTMIDFIQAHAEEWNADMSKIAFLGISYGAGISLEMAGYDERVTTAVAMSGWNNLTLMLYGNESPNQEAASTLLDGAKGIGRVPSNLTTMLRELEKHIESDLPHLMQWTAQRSPQAWLESLNRRNVPMFFSNNYFDNFFRPQYNLDFFEKLTTPKFMLLNQGPHAIPESIGIFIHDNYIWNHAYLWLDHFLKGESNNILDEPNVQMELDTLIGQYVPYSTSNVSVSELYFGPRSASSGLGTLGTTAPAASTEPKPIYFTTEEDFVEGDILQEAMMAAGLDKIANLVQNTSTSAVYVSEGVTVNTSVCGTPSVNLRFKTSDPDQWQFYTFLYGLKDDSTFGALWSHGFYTWYARGPTAGPVARRLDDGSWLVEGAQMHTMCQSLLPGDRVGVAVVLFDKRFTPANPDPGLSLQIVYGQDSVFSIPTVLGN